MLDAKRLGALTIAFLTLCAAAGPTAQSKNTDETSGKTAGKTAGKTTERKVMGTRTVHVDFPGGTLAEFIGALKETADVVNIVSDDKARSVRLPAIKLRRTSVESALEAAAQIAEGADMVNIRTLRDRGTDPVHIVRIKLKKMQRRVKKQPAKSNRHVNVISVRSITEDPLGTNRTMKAETILTAIDTALEVHGGPVPTIKYHADSGLVIFAGSNEQSTLVHELMERIKNDLTNERMQLRTRKKKHPSGAGSK